MSVKRLLTAERTLTSVRTLKAVSYSYGEAVKAFEREAQYGAGEPGEKRVRGCTCTRARARARGPVAEVHKV